MLGAIVGDMAGSDYEHRPAKTTAIEWFPPASPPLPTALNAAGGTTRR